MSVIKKIKPEIKDIGITIDGLPCYDENLIKQYSPPDIYFTDIFVELYIGLEQSKGADIFSAHFVTETYVKEIDKQHRKRMIIIPYYDWDLIINKINELIGKDKYYSWIDFCQSITKYFYWEYENYKER